MKTMKDETTYVHPEVEIINLKNETVICQSVCDGDSEGTGEECWDD